MRPGAGVRDRAFPIVLTVADSLSGEPVPFASVYLKPAKDTIITHFTLSDAQGRAMLDQVVRGEYNLNVEMMGYKPYRKKFYFTDYKNLGKILLQEDARVLEAAKVTAAVAPIEIKGDTVVYNAAAYDVAQNDMLKDLLKKMPGIEVDDDGSVKVQGESVNQITVNGRTFSRAISRSFFFTDAPNALRCYNPFSVPLRQFMYAVVIRNHTTKGNPSRRQYTGQN